MNEDKIIHIKENNEITEKEKTEIIDLLNEYVSFGLMDNERLNFYLKESIVRVLKFDDDLIGVVILNKITDYIERLKGNETILEKLNEKGFGKSNEIHTIDLLVVIEKERNKGYGRVLIDEALRACEGKEVIRYIWLNPDNELKLNSILGSGFIKIGEIEDYWFDEGLTCPYCSYSCRCPVVIAIKREITQFYKV